MLLLLCSAGVATAQSTLKTAYFMDRMTTRHEFNPALMNEYGYFSMPVLGDINFGVNSSLAVDDLIYSLDNGNLGTFAHPDVDSSKFLSGLKDNNMISQDFSLSVLAMGFHAFGGFNTIDISVRENLDINLKKSLFEFMAGSGSGSYSMGGSTIDLNSWAELSLGHSRKINRNLTIGAKLKYLMGVANASLDFTTMDFSSSSDELNIDLEATGTAAMTGMVLNGAFDDISFDQFDLSNGSSSGMGIDLGATYETRDFTFSLSLTDIGFIKWQSSQTSVGINANFTGFEGLDLDDFEGSTDNDEGYQNLVSSFEAFDDMSFTEADTQTTWLPTNLNVGVEYKGLADCLSVGALYSNTFGAVTTTELMLVATVSPVKWFDVAISGTTSSYGTYWGWAVNFCPRWINFFVGMDSMIGAVNPQYLPLGSTNVNVKFGLSFPLGSVHKVN